VEYYYDNIIEKINLQTLYIRSRHFDVLFSTNAFKGGKICPSVFETDGIRVSIRNTSARSVAHPAAALKLDVFLLQMQCVHVQISFET
jgi:hypothetical protein